jgi:hypothetical protein
MARVISFNRGEDFLEINQSETTIACGGHECNMFILYITSRYSHFNILFSKPCQRQYELLPSLGVRRLSFVYFSHFNLLL